MRDPRYKLWPKELRPRDVTPAMVDPTISGGPTISSAPQLVASASGRWRLVYHEVRFREENILKARALLAYLARSGRLYVGPMNGIYSPAGRANVATPTLAQFSNGYKLSSGYKLAQRIWDCTLDDDVKAGDVRIPVNNSPTAPLSAGDYFEIEGRLHVIQEIRGDKWTIWPELRADYTFGTVLEIDDPRMLARLDPKSQALACQMQLGWTGLATFEFLEERW
ncbi:hypothetical protein [Methylocystis echinoides]|uniref:hypothetical protein n=1 Tax=Methylocystis echinoides TaxID=29468 RepID=UPI00343DEF1D